MTGPHEPWLALVESNTTGSGRQFCAAARARGLRPVVLTARPDRYPYLESDQVDALVLDTADLGAVLDACGRLGEDPALAGVTSSSEYFSACAAQVAAKLGLPAPDHLALAQCRHKDRQRAALADAGVPVPAFRCADDVDGAVAAARAIGLPVVVKPTSGSGSIGVRLCHDAAAVASHAAGLLAVTVNERGLPVPPLVLVEEYVPGPEFSVETFDTAVVGVVAKHLGPAPSFVEVGHDFPGPVAADLRDTLGEVAQRAVAALGVGWAAAHSELRLSPRGPVLIEVNPRLAGGMIPTLVRLASGVDLVDAVVARASGHRPAIAGRTLAHASIRFVMASGTGTVVGASGLDRARGMPGVALAEAGVRPGDQVAVTHSFRDRLGYAVATGPDAAVAADRAEQAASHIHIEIRQEH